MPCAHEVACLRCASRLGLCPICRTQVGSVLKVFTADAAVRERAAREHAGMNEGPPSGALPHPDLEGDAPPPPPPPEEPVGAAGAPAADEMTPAPADVPSGEMVCPVADNESPPPLPQQLCLRCATRAANCVFLPCSHKVWCTECAAELPPTCCICDTGITQSAPALPTEERRARWHAPLRPHALVALDSTTARRRMSAPPTRLIAATRPCAARRSSNVPQATLTFVADLLEARLCGASIAVSRAGARCWRRGTRICLAVFGRSPHSVVVARRGARSPAHGPVGHMGAHISTRHRYAANDRTHMLRVRAVGRPSRPGACSVSRMYRLVVQILWSTRAQRLATGTFSEIRYFVCGTHAGRHG
jgi:hypothetical protein